MIAPYNCVVVANGRFPQTALPLHLLHQASVVIACDGAVEALDKAGITPTAIVGDLDSIPSRFREQYADRIHIVEDQEINDLTKSVRFAHRSGQQEVLILGATGLREDHTLGNISLLMDYAPLFQRIEMLSDYGIFTPILQTATLDSPFLARPFRHDFHHRAALAHPQPPADSLVARHVKRGNR